MPLASGRMRYRLTLLRRAVVAGNPGGVARGEFVAVYEARCVLRQASATQQVAAGVAEDPTRLSIRIRDCAAARQITAADRARLHLGAATRDYAIDSVQMPDAINRTIDLVLVRKAAG